MKNSIKNIREQIIYAPINFVGYSFLVGLGEGMKYLTKNHILGYNWITGHLADFGASASLTAMFYGARHIITNKFLSYLPVIAVPTIWSLLEKLDAKPDIQDILMYWVGAGVGILTTKLTKQIIEKNIYDKLEHRLDY